MLITNKEHEDRYLVLYGGYWFFPSKMLGESGIQYIATEVNLAGDRGKEWVKGLLVSTVPAKAGITFEGISPQASLITSIEIACQLKAHSGEKTRFTVRFQDIPLSR